jgi:hypothetical protein
MPKLAANAFINKHATRICLHLQFFDHYRLAAAARKAKLPLIDKDGKDIPKPSDVVSALLRNTAKGDHAIRSQGSNARQGIMIQVMLATKDDVKLVLSKFEVNPPFKKDNGAPCTAFTNFAVDMDVQMKLAKSLALI